MRLRRWGGRSDYERFLFASEGWRVYEWRGNARVCVEVEPIDWA